MRWIRRILGCVLLLAALAWVASPLWSPALQAARTQNAQEELRSEVPQIDARPATVRGGGGHIAAVPHAAPVEEGRALVAMRIPRFGEDWRWTALEGTSEDVLTDGPGHYSGSPLPGERGNVAFAAHRAGYGDPFIDFDRLQIGDTVVFEQGQRRWVYELTTDPEIIDISENWVLDPLAGRQLTLTTCWPKYGSDKRMYVRARLAGSSLTG